MTELDDFERKAIARRVADVLVERQVIWDREQTAATGIAPSDDDASAWLEEQIQDELDVLANDRTRAGGSMLSMAAESELADAIRLRLSPLRRLLDLLSGPMVENVSINNHRTTWIYLTDGSKHRGPALADSDDDLADLVRLAGIRFARSERRFDHAHPFLDVQVPDGSRLHAIMSVTEGVAISIRKHRHITVTLDELVDNGTVERDLAAFLAAAIRRPDPANILIAGGTNAGKTTFLRALISEIDVDERLITIEDPLELMLTADEKRGDVLELEARVANIEGQGEITMRQLVRESLRMRPDRLIVGEVRGVEVIDMLNAMSTGNDGSLSTIHADSARSAINRVLTYGWQADMPRPATAAMLADSVHLIVHLKRLPSGSRVVTQVIEITGNTTDDGGVETLELWAPGPGGRAAPTGVQPSVRLMNRLAAAGYRRGDDW